MAKRHEVTVLTPTFEGSTRELIRDGVRYIRLGRKIGNHGSSHHITFFFSLPKAIRTMDYDLLIEDFMPPMSSTLNPLFAKSPVIASVQWFFAEALSKQYKMPFYLGERYGVKLYKNFIVLTEKMKIDIQQRNTKAHFRVIANGIDAQLLDIEPEFDDFILFLGRVDTEQKGVDLLLKAYAQIPDSMKIPLILAGHCFQIENIQNIISLLGLDKWVKMPGKVQGEDKDNLLKKCRFVCIPSREETFGMVITESCACGKIVVLFDKSPMNEVASANCIKVEPYDTNKYAKAMVSMLEEGKDSLLDKSHECKTWARKYDWDVIANQQEEFYQEVYERG